MKFGFIYVTTNLINGKQYIGKCQYDRSNGWENYLGSGKILRAAINKYGIENFSREIIYEASSKEELNNAERKYIADNNACHSDSFYNIADGGSGGNTRLGYSEKEYKEYCRKFSATGSLNGMYGRKHSNVSKRKNGEKTKSRFANNPEYKKRHSDAVKAAMTLVDKDKLKYNNRSKNKLLTCVLCGNIENVYTSQQRFCSICKSKYSRWQLGELKKGIIENIC